MAERGPLDTKPVGFSVSRECLEEAEKAKVTACLVLCVSRASGPVAQAKAERVSQWDRARG